MRCLFTYNELKPGESNYSIEGLKKLNPKLTKLNLFPYTAEQQLSESRKMAGKISIQGIQPKLSVQLSLKESVFEIVERHGTYIVKPPVSQWAELPENEDLTMHLAAMADFEVPWHGLIKAQDERLSYVIKRFDRKGKGIKYAQEDFAQLMGATSTTKYEATMEDVAGLIEKYCTFKTLEWRELFRRTIFCFLIGNEDMHLKNFSVTTAPSGRIHLTPFYDFLNSTIAAEESEEELALPIKDTKRGFNRKFFVEEFAVPHLYIPATRAEKEIDRLLDMVPKWKQRIEISFLGDKYKNAYTKLLESRSRRLA